MTFCCGKRLKKLRLSRGLKQEELAEKVGLTSATIINIEQGYKARDLSLQKLATFFGTNENFEPLKPILGWFSGHPPTEKVDAEKMDIIKMALELAEKHPDLIRAVYKEVCDPPKKKQTDIA